MKLGSFKNGTRDGALCVVSRDLKFGSIAYDVAPTLQSALDDWDYAVPRLEEIYDGLNRNPDTGRSFQIDFAQFHAPLPRAFYRANGSAYTSYIERARRARSANAPKEPTTEPVIHQAASDGFVGPRDEITVESDQWDIDLEGEVGVVTGDVPMGVKYEKAGSYIRLFMLLNGICLRNLASSELEGELEFLPRNTWTSFAPVAVTVDELGDDWDGRKVKLPLVVHVNEDELGRPNAGADMTFNFLRLISHAARSRPLGAGSIVGSGVVSNKVTSAGFACIAEKRAWESTTQGQPVTRFLRQGDRIRLEMFDPQGNSIFGAIDQMVGPPRIGSV
ncbi:MAG: fumarylacetoacetate hydrolase family protein [Burkholderiales bacterium]